MWEIIPIFLIAYFLRNIPAKNIKIQLCTLELQLKMSGILFYEIQCRFYFWRHFNWIWMQNFISMARWAYSTELGWSLMCTIAQFFSHHVVCQCAVQKLELSSEYKNIFLNMSWMESHRKYLIAAKLQKLQWILSLFQEILTGCLYR